MTKEKFYGQVLDLLDDETGMAELIVALDVGDVQVRRFDPIMFEGLQVNDYVTLEIETGKGYLNLRIEKTNDDIAHYFVKPDYFANLENSKFFTGG